MTHTFTVTLKDTPLDATLHFDQYQDNGRTALLLIDPRDDSWIDATVNIPEAFIPNSDYAVIKDYGYSVGMADALISAGIIEPEPVTFARSGFITAPVHRFTDKVLEIRDSQYAKTGL